MAVTRSLRTQLQHEMMQPLLMAAFFQRFQAVANLTRLTVRLQSETIESTLFSSGQLKRSARDLATERVAHIIIN